MAVGIEKINLYGGRYYLDMLDLARARGKNLDYIQNKVMCQQRAIFPAYEDAVTMAVNAVNRLNLTPSERNSIGLLIVATESAVDFGKPVSTWVQRFCNLSANCCNFEVKHACYGGVAALQMAAAWIASGLNAGKKALIVGADCSRRHLDDGYEFSLGGVSSALLISDNPVVLELELDKTGFWTTEISDTFRPTASLEAGDPQTSLYSYMDALEGAFEHFQQAFAGQLDYVNYFKKHIYHAPFPGMSFEAHRTILNRLDFGDKKSIRQNYQEKVKDGITFAQRLGSCYGSSNFVCLLGLLHYSTDLQPGDAISLFAYGSGCQSQFYSGRVTTTAQSYVNALEIDHHLNERIQLSVDQYEVMEYSRESYIDLPFFEPRRIGFYEEAYKGQNLLVLKKVELYQRVYEWS